MPSAPCPASGHVKPQKPGMQSSLNFRTFTKGKNHRAPFDLASPNSRGLTHPIYVLRVGTGWGSRVGPPCNNGLIFQSVFSKNYTFLKTRSTLRELRCSDAEALETSWAEGQQVPFPTHVNSRRAHRGEGLQRPLHHLACSLPSSSVLSFCIYN